MTIAHAGGAGRLRLDWCAGLLIALAIVSCVIVTGFGATVLWLSVSGGASGGYTASHYVQVLGDPFTYRVLGNTLQFAAISLIVSLAIALPIAWLVERTDLAGKSAIYTLMTTALLLPNFAIALGWVFLIHPRIGLANAFLMDVFGLAQAPFNVSSILGMGWVEGLNLVPVAFIMIASAFRAMDPSLEEAASMAGATTRRTLQAITLPVLKPVILGAAIYCFTIAFAAFDVPAIIGLPARIFTFSTYIYSSFNPFDGRPEYGAVATLSMVMIAFGLLFSWWYGRVQARTSRFAVLTGKAYRPRIHELTSGRLPATCFVGSYFILAQALPILVLLWTAGLPYLQVPSTEAFGELSWQNFSRVADPLFVRAFGNTVLLMLAVPTVTLAASVALSWVVLRSRLPGRAVLDFIAFLPQTIPGVVFSVAALLLTLFVLRTVLPIYGTIWLLILVYSVARLGYGTRMTNGAFVQIHRELEEAAQMSGARTATILRSVILRLAAPTLISSWIWIALLAYRELTLPALLSSAGNRTLSVLVWGFVSTSTYGPAAAITIVMLLLITPVLLLYWIVSSRFGKLAP